MFYKVRICEWFSQIVSMPRLSNHNSSASSDGTVPVKILSYKSKLSRFVKSPNAGDGIVLVSAYMQIVTTVVGGSFALAH